MRPQHPAMQAAQAGRELLARWQRLELYVRCALAPEQPDDVQAYVQAGLLLARRGILPAIAVHRRLLQTLLRSARDEALPWFWRSVCLEQVHLPLAQLSAALALHDPLAARALADQVQQARNDLPVTPHAG
jgi:hypothetical protein